MGRDPRSDDRRVGLLGGAGHRLDRALLERHAEERGHVAGALFLFEVIDVALAVGSDCRAVRAALHFCHCLLASIRKDSCQTLAHDLDKDHRAVGHDHGSFRKLKPGGDDTTLIATYTYLDAEKTSSADITQPKGARLPRRPRNEVYASASYLWCKKLRTTISAKWVNAREELSFGEPNFDIEDYSFVNFAAEYEINPHLSIFGRIDNITNEHYAEVFGFPALGRAAYGGMRVSF